MVTKIYYIHFLCIYSTIKNLHWHYNIQMGSVFLTCYNPYCQTAMKVHVYKVMNAHFVWSCGWVLLPSGGFPVGTARCFLERPSFLLPVTFVLLTSAFPSREGSCVGWQLSSDLDSAFCGSCFDAASFCCVFFSWYIKSRQSWTFSPSLTVCLFLFNTYRRYPFSTQKVPTLRACWGLVAGDVDKWTSRIQTPPSTSPGVRFHRL